MNEAQGWRHFEWGARSRGAPLKPIWRCGPPASRPSRPQAWQLRPGRRRQREDHPVGRAAGLRRLEGAADLLDELAHEGEPERLAPAVRCRNPDAVVADRQDPILALLAERHPDGAAALVREGVVE